MKKSIIHIEGVQKLNRNQQAKIKASHDADCCVLLGGGGSALESLLNWICDC